MYQGKFDAKAKGQAAPAETLETILKERQDAINQRAARKAARPVKAPAPAPAPAPEPENKLDLFPETVKQEPIPVKAPPKAVPGQEGLAKKKRKPESEETLEADVTVPAKKEPRKPAKQESAKLTKQEKAEKLSKKEAKKLAKQEKAEAPRKKGPRIGGIIFYTLYFLFIFAFFVGVFGVLNWLNGWLKAYEAAQPTVKCQQVFDELFANPDWARLYRLAGIQDTDFETVDQYVAFMEKKVGGEKLNYVQTSAGLSNNKKYIVRLGKERVASFTLEGDGQSVTDIPNWRMGDVELFINRNQSITIKKMDTHIAYVNGVPLDDSYTIQIASSRADEFLPSGTPQIRTSIQTLSGLMGEPDLVVYDQTGANRVSVAYNPDTGMYEEQTSAIAMTDAERAAVFGALESYAGFMINASGSRAGVAKYFDTNSKAYRDITEMGKELWMNADRGHTFEQEEILGYTKHTDNLFSVRAHLNMHVICKDATEKDYEVTESMFFVRKGETWVCNEMTNIDITEPVGRVRLTFCKSDGTVIATDFYDTDASSLTTPPIDVPAGKTFSGWARIEKGENNNTTWDVVFQPDAAGNVYMNGTKLTPMTLYPLFE